MQEIEYKFLVNKEQWDSLDKPEPTLIVQGFLSKSEDLVVRIRIKGNNGFLTLKGATKGITRTEFEYEIPLNDAEAILAEFTEKSIRKHRYLIEYEGKTWEVDVFHDKLEGLILAELEVASIDETFLKPSWVTKNVSEDPNYYNAVLIDRI
ncbi:MAG: CYTH domain-containing protein [Crocinitomicaceae bacterium]|nr:CYTH domain-containing protein [Crocinitomicaceae bacterium]